jgi:hypothetical protein
VPVVGMAEAAVEAACRLGRRFAIVTGGAAWAPMLTELVTGLGRSDRLAAIRTVEQSGDEIARDPASALDRLVDACNACADEDGASSVILGGAGLAGLAASVQGSVPVPVICSVEAGARAALAARDHGRGARARSTVDSIGLSAALANCSAPRSPDGAQRNPGTALQPREVFPGLRGVYHRAGRRPDPVAPSGLLGRKHDVLRAIPEHEFAQGAQIFATIHDGEKMVAGKLADFAGKLHGAVREQNFGLAQSAGIKNDFTRGRMACRIFMGQSEIKAAQRNPAALAAPAYVNYLLPVGQHGVEFGAGLWCGLNLHACRERERASVDPDHGHEASF